MEAVRDLLQGLDLLERDSVYLILLGHVLRRSLLDDDHTLVEVVHAADVWVDARTVEPEGEGVDERYLGRLL